MSNYTIYFCKGDTKDCFQPYNHLIGGANYLSILVNVLHIIVLSQMQELKSTKFFWVPIQLSINEIFSSFSLILYFGCEIKLAILNLPARTSYWIFAGYVTLCRYTILLFSSLERYIAVIHPLDYQTNTFVKKKNLVTGILMVPLLLLAIFVDRINPLPFCKSPLTVDNEIGKEMKLKIFYFLMVALFSIAISVLLLKVWHKLKTMSKGQLPGGRADKLRTTSQYIIWTFILHQLINLPIILFLAFQLSNLSPYVVHTTQALTVIIGSCYGFANIWVFGYFNSDYWKSAKTILRCKNGNNNRVEPEQ